MAEAQTPMAEAQWHLDADTYLAMVRSEIPTYDVLQGRLAEATADVDARRILDLGCGTGETARHVLGVHPTARLVGLDSSEAMLRHARRTIPTGRFDTGRLEDPLPAGDFDLVVSAFAIHHLPGPGKADLYRRIARALRPGGRFVWCDVVVADATVLRPVPIEPGVDLPDPLPAQLRWLEDAGFEVAVVHAVDDLAIVAGDRR